MAELLDRLWREEEGQDLTEYALLLVLISLVVVVAVGRLGSTVNSIFTHVGRHISPRPLPSPPGAFFIGL